MTTSVLAVALPGSAALGLLFLALGAAATLLMYRLWGYPYDKATRTSAAPRWATWLHRGIGYAFAICYVVLMARMVPRIWTYQVELPPRTVAHLLLGVTIGFLLLVKILILRFFRHFEEWMPYLGTAILLCTVLLLVLSLPFAFREHELAHAAPGGDPFGAESQARVARLLPLAGMPADTDLHKLATRDALAAGRQVVIEKCVTCHDLKTILDRPRTPEDWWNTVERMGDKPTLYVTLDDRELEEAAAYLIAITPDLQRAAKRKRALVEEREAGLGDVVDAGVTAAPDAALVAPIDAGASDVASTAPRDAGIATDAGTPAATAPPRIDPARARATFETKCSQCHEISDIDGTPPTSDAGARALVRRMIGNGLKITARERELIVWWLDAHYVRKTR
jgi:mono/diheme cytochrome c family protein